MKTGSSSTMTRGNGVGRPYLATDKARAVAFARSRQREGIGLAKVAREVGVNRLTLERWVQADVFADVEIVKKPSEVAMERGYQVKGPRGLVVEGLSIDELAELIKRLG